MINRQELVELLNKIRDDLLIRGGQDPDGTRVANLPGFLWDGLNEAIEDLQAAEPVAVLKVREGWGAKSSATLFDLATLDVGDYPLFTLPCPPADRVPIPQSREQAELMQKLGYSWLSQHARERLQPAKAQVPEGWDAQAYATMRDEITYWKNRALKMDVALERMANDMAPTHMGEPVFNVSRQHQDAAWMSVVNLLNELSPGWIIQEGFNAEEAALKAIRELAASPAPEHIPDDGKMVGDHIGDDNEMVAVPVDLLARLADADWGDDVPDDYRPRLSGAPANFTVGDIRAVNEIVAEHKARQQEEAEG